MDRRSLLTTAFVLASLEVGCTSSEPIAPTDQGGGAAGIAASQEPFVPFSPVSSAPVVSMPVPATGGVAGSTGMFGAVGPSGAGGAGGAALAACAPAPAPTIAPNPMGRGPSFLPTIGSTVTAAKPLRPISGGTLLVLRDGSAAVAADPDRDRIYVVDLKTRALRAQIDLAPGDEPGRVVEDGAGHVHVALRAGGGVAVVDPTAGTQLARRSACAAPRGIAYQTDGDLVHVACADGRLISLSALTGTVLRSVQLDRDLRDVVTLAGGRLMVSTFRHADAIVLDSVGHISERLRPATGQRKGMTGLQSMSPSVAWRMVGTADGGGAVMLHQRGVDDVVNPSAGGYAGGRGCSSIVESSVTVVAPGQTMGASPGLADLALAVDMALSPNGKDVAVAAPGNAHTPMPQVTVTDLSSATTPGLDCMGAGSVVGGGSPGQVVAVAYTPDGTLITQSREPATLLIQGGTISLSTDIAVDTGHTLFHLNAGGGIACASCHPEGGEDGRVWNFACLGPRRTQSMRGGLKGTEPFHWDGDMNDFSKLADEVFVRRMSGPPLSADQKDAMLTWINSIPLLPNPVAADPAVQRGKTLFEDSHVGCSACHAGARLTNNASVDVGTGLMAQVPSLRGVVWRAPFLHSGCAPTLLDRFGSCGGGDKHGQTSHLSAADQSDLVAYLGSL
jgi:hypothetical protein